MDLKNAKILEIYAKMFTAVENSEAFQILRSCQDSTLQSFATDVLAYQARMKAQDATLCIAIFNPLTQNNKADLAAFEQVTREHFIAHRQAVHEDLLERAVSCRGHRPYRPPETYNAARDPERYYLHQKIVTFFKAIPEIRCADNTNTIPSRSMTYDKK